MIHVSGNGAFSQIQSIPLQCVYNNNKQIEERKTKKKGQAAKDHSSKKKKTKKKPTQTNSNTHRGIGNSLI